MGVSARGPKLPKRNVIERLTKKGPECLPQMMIVLSCFKENSFNEAKCATQMRALSECVGRQVSYLIHQILIQLSDYQSLTNSRCICQQPEAKSKSKSTIFYHLKRLYYMQRR